MPSPYNRPIAIDPGVEAWFTWNAERRFTASLVALIAVLTVTRFVGLGTWSLWLDEALTLADSIHGQDVTNPLGYAVMGFLFRLGDVRPSEAFLRLPSALLGIGTILGTWLCFKNIVGKYAGLGATLIVAGSSWHLYWSQNARFYTLTMFLCLLGGGLVLSGVRKERGRRVLGGLALLGIAPLAHPSATLLFAALLVALWIARWRGLFEPSREKGDPWKVLSFAVLVVAFIGPAWLLQVLVSWGERKGDGSPIHFVTSTGYMLTPTVGLALLLGLWVAFRKLGGLAFVLASTAFLGLLFAFVLSFFVRVSAQYVFVLLPFLAVTAALPLTLLEARVEASETRPSVSVGYWKGGLFLAVVLLPGAVDSGLYFLARHGDRPRWREAYRYVQNEYRPGDMILGMDAPVGEYYLDSRSSDLRNWRRVTWLDSYRSRVPERWSRHPRRLWMVVQPEQLLDWAAADREHFLALLEQECRLVEAFPIPLTPRSLGLEVWIRD